MDGVTWFETTVDGVPMFGFMRGRGILAWGGESLFETVEEFRSPAPDCEFIGELLTLIPDDWPHHQATPSDPEQAQKAARFDEVSGYLELLQGLPVERWAELRAAGERWETLVSRSGMSGDVQPDTILKRLKDGHEAWRERGQARVALAEIADLVGVFWDSECDDPAELVGAFKHLRRVARVLLGAP